MVYNLTGILPQQRGYTIKTFNCVRSVMGAMLFYCTTTGIRLWPIN